MVAINALCALDIAIIIMHRYIPSLTRSVLAAPGTAFRVLDGDVKTIYLDMPLLVITCFFLPLGRLSVNVLALGRHLSRSIGSANTMTTIVAPFCRTLLLCSGLFHRIIRFFCNFFRFLVITFRRITYLCSRNTV